MPSPKAEETLAALRELDGHPITPRLLDRLPGGRVEWRIVRELGRITIRNRAWYQDSRIDGVELQLSPRIYPGVTLDAAWVERTHRLSAGARPPRQGF